jgi:lipopolysaccharide/colanic/teichoic acid biosynthesis glycosyltransferase
LTEDVVVSVHARVETAPYFLIALDAFVAAAVAALTLPFGVLQFAVPVIVLLVIYAGGEYSVLSESRVHPRLGVFLACAFLVLVCSVPYPRAGARWLMSVAAGGRPALAAACCLALVAAHGALGRILRTRGRRYLFHLRPDMERAGESLSRHLRRSGYPARVVLDADAACPADRLPVDEWITGFSRGKGSREAPPFDPALFCDTALRLLPPAVLSIRNDYVGWDSMRRTWADLSKRAFDIVAASVLLLLSLPVLAGAFLLLLAFEGRPVLFRQVRVGRFGVRFSLLKLRTLRKAAPGVSAMPNDDIEERVFPLGAILRKTRLDELPQLINILRGDMSLVGPRPEMEYFHVLWSKVIPFYRKRLLVRPGLTGWAQVRFPHTSTEPDYWDKTAYDLWYVVHRNIVLDMRICLRTAGVMLFGAGAR